jgi:hypothetical protein
MRKVSMTLRLSRMLRTKPRLKSRLSAKKKLTAGKSNAMTAGTGKQPTITSKARSFLSTLTSIFPRKN